MTAEAQARAGFPALDGVGQDATFIGDRIQAYLAAGA